MCTDKSTKHGTANRFRELGPQLEYVVLFLDAWLPWVLYSSPEHTPPQTLGGRAIKISNDMRFGSLQLAGYEEDIAKEIQRDARICFQRQGRSSSKRQLDPLRCDIGSCDTVHPLSVLLDSPCRSTGTRVVETPSTSWHAIQHDHWFDFTVGMRSCLASVQWNAVIILPDRWRPITVTYQRYGEPSLLQFSWCLIKAAGEARHRSLNIHHHVPLQSPANVTVATLQQAQTPSTRRPSAEDQSIWFHVCGEFKPIIYT